MSWRLRSSNEAGNAPASFEDSQTGLTEPTAPSEGKRGDEEKDEEEEGEEEEEEEEEMGSCGLKVAPS